MSTADGRVQQRSAYDILIKNSRFLFQAVSNGEKRRRRRENRGEIEGELGRKRPRKTSGSQTDDDNPSRSCHNMAATSRSDQPEVGPGSIYNPGQNSWDITAINP